MTAFIRRVLSIPPEGYPPDIQITLWKTAGVAMLWVAAAGAVGTIIACLFAA